MVLKNMMKMAYIEDDEDGTYIYIYIYIDCREY